MKLNGEIGGKHEESQERGFQDLNPGHFEYFGK
jgi:hypothetical protein